MDGPEKGDYVTPYIDIYKINIQYDGSLDKLKLITIIRGYFNNKEMIGDTWASTASTITMKYFLANSSRYKEIVHRLNLIGTFLQANSKHRVFVKLDSRYGEYFPEYAKYFGISSRLKKSMYGMNNYGKLFDDELTNWLMDE